MSVAHAATTVAVGSHDSGGGGSGGTPLGASPSTHIWRNFLWRDHVNGCIPIQQEYPEAVDRPEFQFFFTLIYLFIWLSAITANVGVIYVVSLKQVSLSSVRSVFICSLAVNDIVMATTSLPTTAVHIFTRDWVYPPIACQLSGIFQGGSIFVSSMTLTAIAVDRYMLITKPAAPRKISVNRALHAVFAIWVLGYTLALPAGVFSSLNSWPQLCGLFCDEQWPDADENGISKLRRTYGLIVLITQFGLPVVISSLCYWSIGRVISRQVQKRHRQQALSVDNQERLAGRKSRSSRMMVAMVGCLVLAWLPLNFINLWRDFGTFTDLGSTYTLVFAACHATAMTSALSNCVIYSLLSPQFRDTLMSLAETRRRQSRAASTKLLSKDCKFQRSMPTMRIDT